MRRTDGGGCQSCARENKRTAYTTTTTDTDTKEEEDEE